MGSRVRIACFVLCAVALLGASGCGAPPRQTGVAVIQQSDGSSLVVDYDMGYSLGLDAEWLVVPLVGPGYDATLATAVAGAPEFANRIQTIKFEEPDARVYAINVAHEGKYMGGGGMMTYVSIVRLYGKDDVHPSLSSYPLIARNQAEKNGYDILSSGTHRNRNGVEYASVDLVAPPGSPYTEAQGELRAKLIYLSLEAEDIGILFWTPVQFADELVPAVEGAADSIQILGE